MYILREFSVCETVLVTMLAFYVFYIAKVLGKSVKPIPVMILGVLLAHKKYPWLKYMFVLMITTGVAMFMYKPSKVQAVSETSFMFGWGEFLLVCTNNFTVEYNIFHWKKLAWKTELIYVN